MTLAHPLWLGAAVVVAALFVWLAQAASRRAAKSALAYSDLAFFETATGLRGNPALPIAIGCAAGIVALGAALASPRVVAVVPVRGVAVVLCVDTSGSMRATDVAPSRSDAAAAAVRAFVDAVPDGTRIGIVAFSSGAGVVAPLSDDKDALRDGDAPNLAIVTAYNDMLSAHQPLERFPELIKRAARDRADHRRGEQPRQRPGAGRAADRRRRHRDRHDRDRHERQRAVHPGDR